MQSYARIIKGHQKGFVTRNITTFQQSSEDQCPVCMTDLNGDEVEDLHKIAIQNKCTHKICGMCFYIMKQRYCRVDSYDAKCPLCREKFEINDLEEVTVGDEDLVQIIPELHSSPPSFPEMITSTKKESKKTTELSLFQKICESIPKEYRMSSLHPSGYGGRQPDRGGRGGRGRGRYPPAAERRSSSPPPTEVSGERSRRGR